MSSLLGSVVALLESNNVDASARVRWLALWDVGKVHLYVDQDFLSLIKITDSKTDQ